MIDPKKLGLDSRTVVEKDEDGSFCIIVNRKSRIIMADGRKILDKVNKIKAFVPHARVKLKTSAPLCSKTRTYLEEQGVSVLSL